VAIQLLAYNLSLRPRFRLLRAEMTPGRSVAATCRDVCVIDGTARISETISIMTLSSSPGRLPVDRHSKELQKARGVSLCCYSCGLLMRVLMIWVNSTDTSPSSLVHDLQSKRLENHTFHCRLQRRLDCLTKHRVKMARGMLLKTK
jgi:hypothetical protein